MGEVKLIFEANEGDTCYSANFCTLQASKAELTTCALGRNIAAVTVVVCNRAGSDAKYCESRVMIHFKRINSLLTRIYSCPRLYSVVLELLKIIDS